MTEKRKKLIDKLLAKVYKMNVDRTWPITEDELINHPDLGNSFDFGFLCGYILRDREIKNKYNIRLKK